MPLSEEAGAIHRQDGRPQAMPITEEACAIRGGGRRTPARAMPVTEEACAIRGGGGRTPARGPTHPHHIPRPYDVRSRAGIVA